LAVVKSKQGHIQEVDQIPGVFMVQKVINPNRKRQIIINHLNTIKE
jgi:hypothetical protein